MLTSTTEESASVEDVLTSTHGELLCSLLARQETEFVISCTDSAGSSDFWKYIAQKQMHHRL